jgi:hypothetical protein
VRAIGSVNNIDRCPPSIPPYSGKWMLGTTLSRRTSFVPPSRTVRKRSSTCFVIWVLHRGTEFPEMRSGDRTSEELLSTWVNK